MNGYDLIGVLAFVLVTGLVLIVWWTAKRTAKAYREGRDGNEEQP